MQGFLFTSGLPHGYLNMLLPVVAAAVALIAALAGFAMVKFFGIIFLGQPREEKLANAHDADPLEQVDELILGQGRRRVLVRDQRRLRPVEKGKQRRNPFLECHALQ